MLTGVDENASVGVTSVVDGGVTASRGVSFELSDGGLVGVVGDGESGVDVDPDGALVVVEEVGVTVTVVVSVGAVVAVPAGADCPTEDSVVVVSVSVDDVDSVTDTGYVSTPMSS